MDFRHHLVQVVPELVDSDLFLGGDEDAGGLLLRDPAVLEFVQGAVLRLLGREGELVVGLVGVGIDLVEDHEDGLVRRADVAERLLHHLHLLFEVGVRDVHHVHEDIGLPDLVQGALEGLYQLRRQFPDEADGVAQQEGDVLDDHLPDGRVQGGEELVLREDVGFREEVHQGALAHVGVTHERQAHEAAAVAPLGGHLAVHLLEVLLQLGNPLFDDPAVHLDLGLTHTAAGAHAAPLPLQVCPHAGEPWQHVLIMSQFHLHLRIGGLGSLGEDLQDQAGAVDDVAALDELLDVALLRAGELIVEDDILDFVLLAVLLDFLKFARADVRRLVGAVHPLHEHLVADGAGRLRKELKFIQVFLDFPLSSLFEDDTHEYRFLCLELTHSFLKS